MDTISFDGKMLHVGERVIGNVRENGISDHDYGSGDVHHTRRVRVLFESGWELSVVWGTHTYSSNYWADKISAKYNPELHSEFTDEPTAVEVAACSPGDGMVGWPDGDTVQGHVSADELSRLIDYMATWPSGTDFTPNDDWREKAAQDLEQEKVEG